MVQMNNVTMVYDNSDVAALDNFSLTINEGEFAFLVGPSGSGKTTLLRCLNFLERPDTGCIRVNGETMWDAADPATQRESEIRKKRLHFGLVFQNFNLFPHLFIRLSGNPKRQADKNTYYTSPIKHISHLCFRFTSDN